jgi:hypothetical protein
MPVLGCPYPDAAACTGVGPIFSVCAVMSLAISANLGPMADDRLNICTRSGSMPISSNVF